MLYKQPIWSKAYFKPVNNGIALAIPIHFQIKSFIRTEKNRGINFDKLNYLLITKTADGHLIADWVTLYPTLEWIKGDQKNYLGKITVKDWDGNLKTAYNYDGKKTLSYKPFHTSLELLDLNQFKYTGSAINGGSILNTAQINTLMGRKYKDINGE